jgi:hypothetical protein
MKNIVTLCTILGALTLSSALLQGQNYPVCQPPIITNQPASQNLTQYQNVTFTVTVDPASTPPLSYQWRTNGVNLVVSDRIPTVTSPTLWINDLSTNDAALYSVMVTNNCATNNVVLSSNAVLTVAPLGLDPYADPDGDGWNNLQEVLNGTDPSVADQPLKVLITRPGSNSVIP